MDLSYCVNALVSGRTHLTVVQLRARVRTCGAYHTHPSKRGSEPSKDLSSFEKVILRRLQDILACLRISNKKLVLLGCYISLGR